MLIPEGLATVNRIKAAEMVAALAVCCQGMSEPFRMTLETAIENDLNIESLIAPSIEIAYSLERSTADRFWRLIE